MGSKNRRKKLEEAAPAAAAPVVPWIALALAILTLGVYWKTTSYAFIPFDDNEYVYKNDVVLRGLTGEGFAWAFEGAHAANWHPLTWLSHMLDVDLFGVDPGKHHRTGVFLHVLATLLLFHLLQKLTGDPWRSGFVAALFALHPLHVESVAWVSERKDTLSGVFWILTTLAYVRWVRRPTTGGYVLMAAMFILGLLSKQMLVTLPFTLLLLDYWPLRRPLSWKLVTEKIPLFALTAIASIVVYLAQRGSAVTSTEALPLGTRIANAVLSYGRYLEKTFWPRGLAIFYPYDMSIPAASVAAVLILLVAISAFAVWRLRAQPSFAVGWFWYLGTLVPVIGIVQIGAQSHADRYTYIPLIGLFIALAWLPIPRNAGAVLGALAIAVLTVVTARQINYWQDGITLFRHAVAVTKDNAVAHATLGMALLEQQAEDEAIGHFREAVRLKPDELQARINLGNLYARRQRIPEAMHEWEESLKLDAALPDVRNNLGVAYASMGRFDEARAQFTKAIELDPAFAPAYVSLGRLSATLGDRVAARSWFERALAIDPYFDEAREELGRL
jgi:tetratricopeptide (TPR) repeat protein